MNRLLLVLTGLLPTLNGCIGSTYILANVQSAELVEQRLYTVVAPTISPFERNHWERKSKSLKSDNLYLYARWHGSFSAAVRVVKTDSNLRSVDELQAHVERGGMEGVRFEKSVVVKTSQPNLLCVRPPLYSEVIPREGSGRFVYLMACVDTKTKIYYELGLSQDVYGREKPMPANGFKAGADNFFSSFKVK